MQAAVRRVVLLAATALAVCGGEQLFTSIQSLRTLETQERSFLEDLSKYLDTEMSRLDRLTSLYQSVSGAVRNATYWETSGVNHPVAAFHLIHRFVHQWREIFTAASDFSAYEELRTRWGPLWSGLPTDEDFYGAYMSLLRLQRVYRLNTRDLARGTIHTRQTSPLNLDDCNNMAVFAFQSQQYEMAIEWVEEALGRQPPPDRLSTYYERILDLAHKMGDKVRMDWYSDLLLDVDPENVILAEVKTAMATNSPPKLTVSMPEAPGWWSSYEALCRGDFELAKNETQGSQGPVWCYLQSSPWSYVPVRVEVMHNDPRIVLFHDIISDDENQQLHEAAFPVMERAKVGSTPQGEPSHSRIGKVGWVYDWVSPVATRLTQRVQEATGLSMDTAEAFQVSTYGIGGQYEPHMDSDANHFNTYPVMGRIVGDRIATFMFYLNEVEAGGSTAFPRLGIRVEPVKNSAVFWYNLHRNGTGDTRTLHAACPILLGEKWVANKWLHIYGQEFIRPCGLSADE